MVPGLFYKTKVMINQPYITENFKNLIGFEQNADPNYPTLPADLLISESGLKVQQLHPLLDIENLYNCSKALGDKFETYLKNRVDTAIIKLINSVFVAKNLNETSRELLTEVRMYEGVGNFQDKIVKQDRFVGFKVKLLYKDLSIIFRNIGMQFDAVNENFKLYVFHSSHYEPLYEIAIAHDKAISFVWKAFDKKILPTIEGGHYFIGYFESDLEGQALNREQYFKRAPGCSSCNHVNYELYNKWSKYLMIEPFYVNADDLDGTNKWDSGREIYVDGTNFGLNLAFSLVCDPSEMFVRNKEMFAEALGKQIAVEFLNDIAYSMRDNQLKQKASQMAFFALGNRDNGQPGLITELSKSIQALNFSTSDLDPVCLPCQDNAMRVSHKSVY
jgi:hypothetical protein